MVRWSLAFAGTVGGSPDRRFSIFVTVCRSAAAASASLLGFGRGSPLLPPLFRVVYSQLCVHWPACEIVACRHRALGYCLPRIVEVRYRVFSFSACKSVQVGRPWLDHDCFLRNLEPAIFVSFTLRRGAFVVQRTQHVDLLLKVSCKMHGCTYAY